MIRPVPYVVLHLAGRTFHRLTVIERAPNKSYTQNSVWRCRCECGTVCDVVGIKLTAGLTKSCGCWRREEIGNRCRTHGKSISREYNAWAAAKQRCHNPKARWYYRYGGAGIAMCAEWRDSFAAFLRDMGPAPTQTHSIDRIDNSRGYEPGNCRWADSFTQANNTRANHPVTFDGMTMNVAQWERHLGVPEGRIRRRLLDGWPVELAMTAPRTPGRRPRL